MHRITVDRQSWSITVRYDPSVTTVAKIQAAIDKATDEVDALH